MTENENIHQKEELIENISELFLKYGLRSTSMEDICSHLKISKKTLYLFFANKDDVVEQVLLYRRASRRKKVDIEKLLINNSIESILLIQKHIIADLASRLPANLFDARKYHPDVYARVIENDSEFIHNTLQGILDRGIQTGLFREDIHQQLQVYLFVKQMSFLGEPEIMSEIKYPLELIVTTTVENFIRSISTLKGLNALEKIMTNKNKNMNGEEGKG